MDEKKKKKPTKGSARAFSKLFHDSNYQKFISDRQRYAQAKHRNALYSKRDYSIYTTKFVDCYPEVCEQMHNFEKDSSDK